MRRSLQEIIELVVFGLIALLVGTGLLWVLGWLFDIVGIVFRFAAGLIWQLLRFVVPIAIIAGAVYGVVWLVQNRRKPRTVAPPPVPVSPSPPLETAPTTEPAAATESASEQIVEEAKGETTAEAEASSSTPESEGITEESIEKDEKGKEKPE
ncbi:MAG: hypothetical protein JSV66_15640 [Trueperaceae bacterium]|nr:MAG: hypothetical protein JSV66_15640 [Trueperaceae bacterium]